MDVLSLSSKEEDTAVQVSLNRTQSNRTCQLIVKYQDRDMKIWKNKSFDYYASTVRQWGHYVLGLSRHLSVCPYVHPVFCSP